MRKKYKFQVVQDLGMLFVLLSLMAYHLWGEYIHEILGVTFLGAILLHVALNAHWFKNLTNGNWPNIRILQVILNVLLLFIFTSAIISGLMLSRHLLPNFIFHNSSDLVRKIHMTCVHWGLVLIGLHLGLHWKMLSNFFLKIWSISPTSTLAGRIMPSVFILISCYGLYQFIQRNLYSYLLIKIDFSFFNFDESRIIFYTDETSICIFVAYLTHNLLQALLFRKQNS
jgi:hypothetical protein